jgi:xanthine dehydrogenase large subunit
VRAFRPGAALPLVAPMTPERVLLGLYPAFATVPELTKT